MSKSLFRLSANVKIGFSNVRIDFFDLVRMSKQDSECQNSLFPLSANVKIGFRMSE